MTYYLAKFCAFAACVLPWALVEKIGECLGALAWLVIPKWRKQLAINNAIQCLNVSIEDAERIAKKSTTRFGVMAMEVLRFSVIKKDISKYVTLEGGEYLEEAVKSGKGGIIATSHSDNWELMGGALSCYGFPLVGVAKKQKSKGPDKFINEQRRGIGMHITYRDDVREMYKMLEKGYFIGLIMDQDTNRHDGSVLDFFGRPTNCTPGAASMARFKKVPIFPGFIHKNEDGTHIIKIFPALEIEWTKDKREDLKRVTQEIVKITEEHIRKYPEEWFWIHDRWKSMRND
ncbi:MAG: lysophospholipid acyltransferase family protein [Selenomonadaceae bacterium]|nr:lysophospholipid acyltransferase family protein [Selenomonadaceae bacterium]